jgi:oligosaccharide repeat unit polymerase
MITGSRFVRGVIFFSYFLWNAYTQSRVKTYLHKLHDFLLASFFSSLFLRVLHRLPMFYPSRAWGIFDGLNSRLAFSLDIFNPLFIFPAVFLGFLAVSSYRVSNLALASIIIGIAAFACGVLLTRNHRFKRSFCLEASVEKITLMVLFIGVSSLVYDVAQTGSIPLLDPGARRKLSVLYTMLAHITVPGGILLIALIGKRLREGRITLAEARMYALATALAVTALMSLLGYRTQIIVSILGSAIAMYYSRILGRAEILVAFVLAFFAISAFGYYRALAQGSPVGFFEVFAKRAALTLSIYDGLVDRFWVFGANRGSVFLASFSSFLSFIPGPRLGPRTIVAQIYGIRDISITSTLYGTVVLDFGIPGIILFSLLLGFILGLAYRAVKQTKAAVSIGIFSLLLAYALVGIETGLVDFNVLMFFLTGFVVLMKSKG